MDCVGLNLNESNEAKEYYRNVTMPFLVVFNPIYAYVYRILCVLGVLANAAIIVVLLRPTMRKSPFNVLLIVIAFCDGFLMATYLVFRPVEFCHPWFFSYGWVLYTKFYAMMSVFVHSISLWLTVNMAVLRYLVLYRGSHANSRLPPCNGYGAALIAIALATVLAFLGSVINMLRYEIRFISKIQIPLDCLINPKYGSHWHKDDIINHYGFDRPKFWDCSWERANFWIAAWMLKLIPCILLTIFMTLLVRMLIETRERRKRLCGTMATSNSQAERTTAMLTVIVFVFLLTELPQGLLTLAAGVYPQLTVLAGLLTSVFDLLSLTNSAVNFVLCALMSHVFRREFLKTFSICCCCWRSTNQARQTSFTTMPRPRRTPSQDPSYSPMLPKGYE